MAAMLVFSFWKSTGLWMEPGFSLAAYQTIFFQQGSQIAGALQLGATTAIAAVMMAFPVAYFLTFRASEYSRIIILSLFTVPFLVNPLTKVLMWIPIFGRNSMFVEVLAQVGILESQQTLLLYGPAGPVLGLMASVVPFVVFTSWLSMTMLEGSLTAAAADLGARPFEVVKDVIVPLSVSGIVIGAIFVFAKAISSPLYASVLGGPSSVSLGLMINRAYGLLAVPQVSALAVLALVLPVAGLFAVTWYLDLDKIFGRGET
jgi:ABC-type spermidine/putrescine transport system permease subunit I